MDTKALSLELYNLQNNVIGVFKPRYSKDYEMVVSNNDGLLKTISIGGLGGLHTTHIPATEGKLALFDNGLTLSDMMKNPFRLKEFMDEFNGTVSSKLGFGKTEN